MPIDERTLAEIRAGLAATQTEMRAYSPLAVHKASQFNEVSHLDRIVAATYAFTTVPELLAFAEAALPILRAVAGLVSDDYCAWEDKHAVMQAVQHAPDCPVTLARRALAGDLPAEGSADQERES